MSRTLNGVALITGAASGIGRGVAVTLAQEGCSRLFLADIDLDGLHVTQEAIVANSPEAQVEVCQADISSEDDVKRMINTCVLRLGRMDYALNIAGAVPTRTPIVQTSVDTFDKIIRINQYGTWLCHQLEIQQMLQQEPVADHGGVRGSIVTVSSLAGINASSGMSPYSASKHSIIGLVKTDAQDYGPHGIRINGICPGMIDTELFRKTSPPDAPAQLEKATPLRRLGKPEDVAYLAAFLCSSKSSFLHGAVIPCDGGLVLQRSVI
ncbi:hypothetical protein FDECE_14816 [Fusarium decemcellulare]|nr:hypothetical protein FDECE_14816 [Fusarium decemcellulare]